jgi:large subunit ribosomal protein L9
MKVILREDIETLGKAGDIVKVADGYGRNHLIPKQLAVRADMRNLRALEHDRRVIEARAKKVRKSAEELGAKLSSLSLTIPAKAGEEGKLFGAVTSREQDGAAARADQTGRGIQGESQDGGGYRSRGRSKRSGGIAAILREKGAI